MKNTLVCVIKDGKMHMIYDDNFVLPFMEQHAESWRTTRVSHVEPAGQQWQADLSPINGPQSPLFRTYQEAVDWEVAWLHEHNLGL